MSNKKVVLGRRLNLFAFSRLKTKKFLGKFSQLKVEEALPRIVEKGTKKAVAASEAPQSARKGEPETQAPLPEYTGEQAGAVVAPETAENQNIQAPKLEQSLNPNKSLRYLSIRGTQAGAIVEPEQVEPEVGVSSLGLCGTRND